MKWFRTRSTQPDQSAQTIEPEAGKPLMVNLGCGRHFHPAWKNLDVVAHTPDVVACDLRRPLPFRDAVCDVVYHSHVLEHFPKALAPGFIKECFRILKPDGIIRVAVPDLEEITRLYLQHLEGAAAGDATAAARHEWLQLEMMDQMARERSGGEMLRYWMQNPMPAEEFVVARMGREVLNFLEEFRKGPAPNPSSPPPQTFEEIGRFRDSGEAHKWMYDRVSLKSLLENAGFSDVRRCSATESDIPNFPAYHLDALENGEIRKPDSLFMEARKPARTFA